MLINCLISYVLITTYNFREASYTISVVVITVVLNLVTLFLSTRTTSNAIQETLTVNRISCVYLVIIFIISGFIFLVFRSPTPFPAPLSSGTACRMKRERRWRCGWRCITWQGVWCVPWWMNCRAQAVIRQSGTAGILEDACCRQAHIFAGSKPARLLKRSARCCCCGDAFFQSIRRRDHVIPPSYGLNGNIYPVIC